ncbi:MAG: pyridoxamine 5'-phosphate oxidase family protein [Deltaproteobacteria bacterium]
MANPAASVVEFLGGRRYATLATFNADLSIHLTPVWYMFEDGNFFISTGADRKFKNLSARPQASVIVESRKQGSEMWISAWGGARLIRGDEAQRISRRIHQRYLTQDGMEVVGVVLAAATEAVIALAPTVWRSHDLKGLDDQFFGGALALTPQKWFIPLD